MTIAFESEMKLSGKELKLPLKLAEYANWNDSGLVISIKGSMTSEKNQFRRGACVSVGVV